MSFSSLGPSNPWPSPHWPQTRKFTSNSFDFACIQCEHSHSLPRPVWIGPYQIPTRQWQVARLESAQWWDHPSPELSPPKPCTVGCDLLRRNMAETLQWFHTCQEQNTIVSSHWNLAFLSVEKVSWICIACQCLLDVSQLHKIFFLCRFHLSFSVSLPPRFFDGEMHNICFFFLKQTFHLCKCKSCRNTNISSKLGNGSLCLIRDREPLSDATKKLWNVPFLSQKEPCRIRSRIPFQGCLVFKTQDKIAKLRVARATSNTPTKPENGLARFFAITFDATYRADSLILSGRDRKRDQTDCGTAQLPEGEPDSRHRLQGQAHVQSGEWTKETYTVAGEAWILFANSQETEDLRTHPHWTRKQIYGTCCREWVVFTLQASNIKGTANKFACLPPVWIGPEVFCNLPKTVSTTEAEKLRGLIGVEGSNADIPKWPSSSPRNKMRKVWTVRLLSTTDLWGRINMVGPIFHTTLLIFVFCRS